MTTRPVRRANHLQTNVSLVSTAAQFYLGSDLLLLGVGLYDWMTRKRFHIAYIAGAAWIVAVQLTAVSLYTNPGWTPMALRLLGH